MYARIAVIALLLIVVSDLRAQSTALEESAYADRPLDLPPMAPGDACPISVGSNEVVASDHGYIFGAGSYFFGTGPAYLGLSWKPASRAEGRFDLVERMPRGEEGYGFKTPWIIEPGFTGEVLVRGLQIGAAVPNQVLFQTNAPAMILHPVDPSTRESWTQRWEVDAAWSFWPTAMIVPGVGCYALQIDTESKSDIVVFEVE